MAKGPTELVSVPSLTVMVMSSVVPTCATSGVPVSAPVCVLNCAHDGAFETVKVRVSLSASLTAGANEYAWPTCTEGEGTPPMLGGLFAGGAGSGSGSLGCVGVVSVGGVCGGAI
jgi:hypothetical protein